MPQTFQVLRCYKCLTFQIHQVKKSYKWDCKLCGGKQSIKRHYGIGTGKDCRMHVQKLNKMQAENVKTHQYDSDSDISDTEECLPDVENSTCEANKSKWSNYINISEETTETDEPMYIHDQKVVLEIPKKSKIRKIKSNKNQDQRTSKIDEADAALFKKSYDNALEINTTLSQQKCLSGANIQNWEPPFNNTEQNNNSFTENNIENVRDDTTYSNKLLLSSNIEEVQQSRAIIKLSNNNSCTQKTNKSKWDEFIEDEVQNTLNDTCEDDRCNIEFIHHSTSQIKPSFTEEAEKDLKIVSSDKEESVPINNFPKNSRIKNKQCESLFSISNDCDLDDILKY